VNPLAAGIGGAAPWSAPAATPGLAGAGPDDAGRARAAVRAELDRVFSDPPLCAEAPDSFHVLWARLREAVSGGKLVRPRLVDLGWRTVRRAPASSGVPAGGTAEEEAADLRSVARVGAAFELLHAALIVHDDVIDRDDLRRGRPTVAEQYRRDAVRDGVPAGEAEHVGRSAGIIAGDLLLTAAFRLAAASGARVHAAEAAESVFRAASAAAAGELEDVLLALHRHTGDHPEAGRILTMERLKTAGYSFEEPLRAGALLAGADPAHAEALAEAGALLGVAYQVVDDVLGIAGDPAVTGKPHDADLREGKATLLTAHGRRDPRARAALDRVARAERHGEGLRELAAAVAEARAALVDAGSVEHALGVAEELVDQARALLDALPMAPAERAEFAATCGQILQREA